MHSAVYLIETLRMFLDSYVICGLFQNLVFLFIYVIYMDSFLRG